MLRLPGSSANIYVHFSINYLSISESSGLYLNFARTCMIVQITSGFWTLPSMTRFVVAPKILLELNPVSSKFRRTVIRSRSDMEEPGPNDPSTRHPSAKCAKSFSKLGFCFNSLWSLDKLTILLNRAITDFSFSLSINCVKVSKLSTLFSFSIVSISSLSCTEWAVIVILLSTLPPGIGLDFLTVLTTEFTCTDFGKIYCVRLAKCLAIIGGVEVKIILWLCFNLFKNIKFNLIKFN